MSEYLFILLGTALVNNVILVRFLGLCPFMGVANKLDSALGMGLATTFVLTVATTSCLYLGAIAALVQFTEMGIRKQ